MKAKWTLFRALTTIIILCFSLSGLSQHTITVKIKNCKTDLPDRTFNSFSLVKCLKTDSVKIGTFRPNGESTIHITDLESGRYQLKYENRFNLFSTLNIFVSAIRDTTSIVLCPDRYNNSEYNHSPLISQIKNGEELTMIMRIYEGLNSNPYNGSASYTLTIARINDIYYLSYNHADSILINPKQYEAIQRFELELNLFDREESCTTFNTYELILGEHHYLFTDVSCSWHGGATLLKKLALKRTSSN